MDLGPHAGFIIASYGICFAVVVGLILWVLVDKAHQEAELKALAEKGITRASTSASGSSAG